MIFVDEKATDIYSKLLESRKIFLFEEITPQLSKQVIAQLLYLDSLNNEPISMYISSKGGCVTSGLSIMDTMDFIKSPVYTYNLGECSSMAAWILSCGEKGHRYSLKNSEVMLHQISTGYNGNIQDIEVLHKKTSQINKKMMKILCEKTKIKENELTRKLNRNWYLSVDEAIDNGIIDEIIVCN